MSSDATMLYETLYRLASKDTECDLFGANAPLAREAFRRALAGTSMPIVWFEVPLSGPPRFDLHVAHGNADLHEHAPFAPDAMDGHGNLLNWYASEPRAGGGLALAYDVGDGRIGAPAVHANVNAAKTFDVEGFFVNVDRPEAAALYRDFEEQLPRGWRKNLPWQEFHDLVALVRELVGWWNQKHDRGNDLFVLCDHLGEGGIEVSQAPLVCSALYASSDIG